MTHSIHKHFHTDVHNMLCRFTPVPIFFEVTLVALFFQLALVPIFLCRFTLPGSLSDNISSNNTILNNALSISLICGAGAHHFPELPRPRQLWRRRDLASRRATAPTGSEADRSYKGPQGCMPGPCWLAFCRCHKLSLQTTSME